MNTIEQLASDIAMLSTQSLFLLAEELVRYYPTRSEALATVITVVEQDQLRSIDEHMDMDYD
jgi:hypothetical protein